MKKVWMCAFALGLLACSESTSENNTSQDQALKDVLGRLSDSVYVPTYAQLSQKTEVLHTAVEAFVAADEAAAQGKLDAVAVAWREARVPWEQSEAFLFGPVAIKNLDPALDSWPVDRNQLDNVLKSGQTLDAAFVADGLGYVLKGFHTAEYLIFRDGNVRKASDVTAREREYLVAVTEVLHDDAQTLYNSWSADGEKYGQKLKSAGEAGSVHVSVQDALQEVTESVSVILDEVANGKLAEPFKSKDPDAVESQFAYNSIRDFANNLRSARNVWTGSADQSTKTLKGLGAIAEAKKAGLGVKILSALDEATMAIEAVPAPFSTHLDADAEITLAIEKTMAVDALIKGEFMPLLSK